MTDGRRAGHSGEQEGHPSHARLASRRAEFDPRQMGLARVVGHDECESDGGLFAERSLRAGASALGRPTVTRFEAGMCVGRRLIEVDLVRCASGQ